jgi:hypothetical protein
MDCVANLTVNLLTLNIWIQILLFEVDWNEGSEPRHWFYVYSQRCSTLSYCYWPY